MEEIDQSKLSEQTKAEMELGKKTAAANAAAMERAEKMRAEEAMPKETDEAQQAADEAKPLEKESTGYPVAGRKVKAEVKGGGA